MEKSWCWAARNRLIDKVPIYIHVYIYIYICIHVNLSGTRIPLLA